MSILVEEVQDQIWVQERHLWFSGVRLRSRTTVVRLSDGRLWVHSPAEPTPEVCGELERLGEVAWLVIPNRFHHLHAAATKSRFPEAVVVGPPSVQTKNTAVVIGQDVKDPQLAASLPEFRILPLSGVPLLEETLFFHEPSRTLIAADLMMCGCARDHWTWRWAARVCGQYGKLKLPPDVRIRTRRGPALRAALDAVLALPVERILVAHSDPIEDQPRAQLAEAWRFALRA